MARKSERFEDTRGLDKLDAVIDHRFDNPDLSDEHIMRNLQMDYHNELHVDQTYKPDDMVYQWAREEIFGQVDTAALISRRRLGWTPVPKSRHPEFRALLDDGKERGDDYIRIRGNILLERHIKYHEVASAKSEEANFEAMRAVAAMEKIGANSVIPIGIRGNEIGFGHSRTFN